jgi:integrase
MPEKEITVWVTWFKDRKNYVLQWRDPDTNKIKSQSADTDIIDVARMKATVLQADLNRGLHKDVSRISWERFRESFEAEFVSGRRPATRENYAQALDALERECSPATLRAVNARMLSIFVGALRKRPGKQGGMMMETTIKTILQFIQAALNWAVEQKLIPECPAFPTVRPAKRKPQPVSTEAVERLLAKAPDENMRVFLLCGWLAGLRLNEAMSLEWDETEKAPYLDVDRDRIVFPAGFVKAAEDQWVPLDKVLRAALLGLPRHGPKVFRFPSRLANKDDIEANAMCHRVNGLARAAGVKMTMKSLRRGFGCYWASRVPAQVLQKLMRHANISLTMTYYANVDDAAMDAILGRQHSEPNKEAKAKEGEETKGPTV